jgi:alanine-synthesizing transaminase
VSAKTRAVVIINPNNPTGAVYPRDLLEGLLEIARRHDLLVLSDEIYDKILYDDAEHVIAATLAPDVLCLTLGGLSKAYRAAGFRSGWMVVSGPTRHAASYIEGLTVLANMRLCANVPAQHAIQTALGDTASVAELVLPGGRLLEQRDVAYEMLSAIPGVSCVKPRGALYAFPRLDPRVHPIDDDEQFVLELLRSEHILLVQGTGFNWPHHDHLRIVTLPHADDLTEAIGRIGAFLERRSAALR